VDENETPDWLIDLLGKVMREKKARENRMRAKLFSRLMAKHGRQWMRDGYAKLRLGEDLDKQGRMN